jgi:hypothetical protein
MSLPPGGIGPSAQLPPYFALLSRAVSILEGIALYGDADYSLVGAASPVAAQWLLISDSPASQQAVNELMETSGLDGLMKLANIAGMESARTYDPALRVPSRRKSCVMHWSLRPFVQIQPRAHTPPPQVACAVPGRTSQHGGESFFLVCCYWLFVLVSDRVSFRGVVRLPGLSSTTNRPTVTDKIGSSPWTHNLTNSNPFTQATSVRWRCWWPRRPTRAPPPPSPTWHAGC